MFFANTLKEHRFRQRYKCWLIWVNGVSIQIICVKNISLSVDKDKCIMLQILYLYPGFSSLEKKQKPPLYHLSRYCNNYPLCGLRNHLTNKKYKLHNQFLKGLGADVCRTFLKHQEFNFIQKFDFQQAKKHG